MSRSRSAANRTRSSTAQLSSWLAIPMVFACLLSTGCGMSEYEARVEKTTRAYRKRDAEAKIAKEKGPKAAPAQPAAGQPPAAAPPAEQPPAGQPAAAPAANEPPPAAAPAAGDAAPAQP